MADPWPATLPQGLMPAGYSEQLQEGTLRSTMDAGPAKLRSRFTALVNNIQGQIEVTAAQKATLDTLYITTLKRGTLPFTWVDPVSRAAVDFRFVKAPKYGARGPINFPVTLVLEVLP